MDLLRQIFGDATGSYLIGAVALFRADLARKHPLVMKEPEPAVFVVDLAESSVNLKLVTTMSQFHKKFEVETTLREQIYETFLQENVEIPFPQRVVRLHPSHAESQNSQKRKTPRR